jgi:hypothetical protein
MPTPSPASSLQGSRPHLVVDGREQAALEGGLLELMIHEATDGLYRCEALFNNWGPTGGGTGFVYFDRSVLDFGKRLAVQVGDHTLFDGHITALEGDFPAGGAPCVRIFAEDRLQDLRMTRRTRSFADASDADAIGRIARDHGLSAQVDVSGPTHKVLAQVNQSDLAFIRERARATDAEVWVSGSTIHVSSRAQRASGGLTLAQGGLLQQFTVRADLARQCTKLVVGGWDRAAKSAMQGEAEASCLGSELGGNEDGGSAVLRQAFGERPQTLAHTLPLGTDEARLHALAQYRQTARRFVQGRGVADTHPQLSVGANVTLEGLGPLFSGKYYVSETQTRWDGLKGLRTEFTGERPGMGRP